MGLRGFPVVRRGVSLAVLVAVVLAQRSPSVAAPSPLGSWRSHGQPLRIVLIALSPENVRAFYDRVAYPKTAIDSIVDTCVFGTVLRNVSTRALSYDIARWRAVTPDGASHTLLTKNDWLRRWAAAGVTADWSLLPPAQRLDIGDWGQGFTTVALPRHARFDLVYSWSQHGTIRQARISGIRCAADLAAP